MQKVLLIVLIILVGAGAYFLGKNQFVSNKQSQPVYSSPASDLTAGWQVYTDPNGKYSFKYPPSWTIKIGLDITTDVAVIDPTTSKKWFGNGGSSISWPAHYIDILSVKNAPPTAMDTVALEEKAWKNMGQNITDAQLNRESYLQGNLDFELYDLMGESAVRYRNVAISDGKITINIASSVNRMDDKSIESQILSTFKLTQ